MRIFASGVSMAVVHFWLEALVLIDAFLGAPVIPETAALAGTFTIVANGGIPALVGTWFSCSTNETVTHPRLAANALFCWRISHGFALGVFVALFARVGRNRNTFAVTFTLVSNLTFGDGAFVFNDAFVVDSDVSRGADAVAYLQAVRVLGDAGCLAIGTGSAGTRVNVLFTDETISFVAGFTFAVVVGFGEDGGVGHTVGVFVAVMLKAGVDRLADETITIVSLEALALVVDLVTDDLRGASGVFVTTTVVSLARILWQAFSCFHVVTVEAVAFITGMKISTG